MLKYDDVIASASDLSQPAQLNNKVAAELLG